MTRTAILSALAFSLALTAALFTPAHAAEVGYIEDFALSRDRTQALKQLIPGTDDYYYYHCLYQQNIEQFDKVEQTLAAWRKRYPNRNYPQRYWEVVHREALLTYAKNPDATLNHLRQKLGLQFNHQRDTLNKKPNLPTSLDQKLISRQTLTQNAYNRHRSLNGFEDRALDWLIATKLNDDYRRQLLSRLKRPDYPNLPQHVVADLRYKYSRGFGSFGIHSLLMLDQLEQCVKLYPELINHSNFVNIYLTKLRPNDDVDWRNDPKAYAAYLDRLWAFVQRLNATHNSLKAHVLYHRLVFDRTQGVWDKERFMTYVKLPRYAPYINNDYMKIEFNRRHPVNLSANYQPYTLLPVIGNDEPVIRSYLHHFFVKETTYKPYETWLKDTYLKQNFAETKIVNGLGDAEQWYSMLSPSYYQQLKERIDLDFAYANKDQFGVDEPVSLDVHVKNVKKLIVKVYEINAANFYRDNLREVDTDINLDGLVANKETTLNYAEAPVRRVRRHYEFPSLAQRGVYVIDFIGNGKSSRVLVRKGKLRYVARTSVAGHVFTIYNEKNQPLKGASLLLSGHDYPADKEGQITVPYSNRPGRQPIVLTHDGFSSFDYFTQQAENYHFVAGIHVDRESLVKRKKANVLIRPQLYLNGEPVTLNILEDVRLVINAIDLDGVHSSKEVSGFKLFEDREAVYVFQTPERLAQLHFLLKARVKNMSQDKKIDLADRAQFTLNQIDQTEKVEDLHMANFAGNHVIELLGKTGERKADRPVYLVLKHRDFRDAVNVTLQTDARGRVALGALEGIDWVQARGPEGTSHTWHLNADRHSYHSTVHAAAGEAVYIPYMGAANQTQRSEVSLLELRGNTFVADRYKAASVANGFIKLDDLPRGDYDLLLKDSNTRIRVRLTEGKYDGSYVLSDHRNLEARNRKPLQIESIKAGDDDLTVKLQNASKYARVHVLATRYQPAYDAYATLSRIRDPEPMQMHVGKVKSVYIAGRNIGDEYRYILERKYARKHPGNMLKLRGLLLNPWAIRTTQTGEQRAQRGESFTGRGGSTGSDAGRSHAQSLQLPKTQDFANLDFLGDPSAIILNLSPDKNGVVTVKREDLGDRQHIHVVAVDPMNTVCRSIALPEQKTDFYDLRLVNGLDPAKHFTEQKQVTVVKKGGKFQLDDITTSKFEAYDNLARVYALYATLSNDAKLIEFSFVLNWHKMTAEQKRDKYSKYACHELNFFIYKKDPKFFAQVVLPYLANKKDKTFLDHWLLDNVSAEFTQPWDYEQLNIVERILLSQRIKGEQQYTSRHVTDLFHLTPPNIDYLNHLFYTALKGSSLDVGDAFGLDKAQNKARPGRKYADELKAAAKMPADAAAFDRPSEGAGAPAAPRPAAPPAATRRPAPDNADRANGGRLAKKEAEEQGRADDADAGKDLAERNLRQLNEKAKQNFFKRDEKRRSSVRQYYRKLDETKEWVENNYYKLPIAQQNANLVTVNGFWNDYARHNPAQAFYSTNLAEASRNFTEMMFALSVLDLPFEAGEHKSEFDKLKMQLDAGSPMVVFHKQVKPATAVADETPILVSQNFFRYGDRYKHVNGEKVDKYVTDEFLMQAVYGCQVVVTNPTSSTQKLDVLLQVPVGAMPVLNGQQTRSVHIQLQPYHTQSLEYYFYFPAPGQYQHYPVHVAKNEQVIAFSKPFAFKVVKELSKIDKDSWDYISQWGTQDQVVQFMQDNNLHRINLDRIAWRMKDKGFFGRVTMLLTKRHAYNHTLFSYGILHNAVASIREYLEHADGFVRLCGEHLESPLLTIDPVKRKTYEFMEYSPLVNARAHQLGKRRKIVNDRMAWQYHRLLKILGYKRQLDNEDLVQVSYYMLLQDRVDEAADLFGRANPQKLASRIQYDYLAAYLDFYSEDLKLARGIVETYKEHPVDKWREAFTAIGTQLDEIQGGTVKVVDDEDRSQQQTKLAATDPNFEFNVEAKRVNVTYQNINEVRVNYYLMDVELLFSRNPFVQHFSSEFSYIRPNETKVVKLNPKATTYSFPLPEKFHTTNVLVEIVGAGQAKSHAYYSNAMSVQVIENYGQVRVTQAKGAKPIPKTYVKVYALLGNGQVKFYKDGYTDLRGRFDFTSLNTNELDQVRKFSLLVLSNEHGAVVREATPPKR